MCTASKIVTGRQYPPTGHTTWGQCLQEGRRRRTRGRSRSETTASPILPICLQEALHHSFGHFGTQRPPKISFEVQRRAMACLVSMSKAAKFHDTTGFDWGGTTQGRRKPCHADHTKAAPPDSNTAHLLAERRREQHLNRFHDTKTLKVWFQNTKMDRVLSVSDLSEWWRG